MTNDGELSNLVDGPETTGLSVVVPCFNEADNIEPCYREIITDLAHYDLELLFVDDGSSDATLDVIKALACVDPRVRFLSFTRNFGFEAAFSAGYRYAAHDWILHLDADQQFPAAEAEKLLAVARTGYDAVFGVRTNRADPLLRRWGTTAFHFLGRTVLGIEIPRGATAFRVVRTALAQAIVGIRLGTPYFLATVPKLTSRYTTVPVAHRARVRGESKVSLRWLAAHAIGLFIGFTTRLATMASIAAVLAGCLAVLLGLATLLGLMSSVAVDAALLGLLAIALLATGLVARYLVLVGSSQARPRQFYIRSANLPVREEDRLFPEDAAVVATRGRR